MIKPDRLNALCNINRWRGWTVRPYSVAEHCAIGAYILECGDAPRSDIVAWWLHDMHETEVVGDVPTPDKEAYMNDAYYEATHRYDQMLERELGVNFSIGTIKWLDHIMFRVENDYIASRRDNDYPRANYDDPVYAAVRECVISGRFKTHEAIFELWDDHGMWGEVKSKSADVLSARIAAGERYWEAVFVPEQKVDGEDWPVKSCFWSKQSEDEIRENWHFPVTLTDITHLVKVKRHGQ